ncbi:hypothetical protein EVJ32_10710 [Exiguobacterium sp. SH5S4]|uniref:hypothetical protein n=1 Tax=Exiguobacterium sp. SH5S4 TaxID=2510961 RepID=UPI00103E6A50|nr:hypothetical protein [Exiguobacterium sp. SH5S4]TCI25264.1 hypothetical protein EVJ32_10710 [Exiguobacterium sp. SH5S4]
MHNTDQTKDDVIETGLDILLKVYEFYRKKLTTENDVESPLSKEDQFVKMMNYVIDNSDDEKVIEIATALKEEPKQGLKIFNLMNDKAKLMGYQDAKEKSNELVAALEKVTESNQNADVPNQKLQEEIDKMKNIEDAKMLTVNTKIKELESKDYSTLSEIKDDRLKSFVELANNFDKKLENPKIKDKLDKLYGSMVVTLKAKKESEKESKEKDNESDKGQDKQETKEGKNQKEIKKQRNREVDMER